MKKVKIGFSKPSTWKIAAQAEMWWDSCSFSHVYLRYTDDQGRDICFQASHGTVHPQLYVHFLSENISVDEIEVEFTDKEYQQMRTFFYEKMGEPYSYKDLAIIFVYDCLKKIGIKFNTSVVGYVCSSLVATMLSEIKGMKFDKSLNLVKPSDLYDILS